MATISQAESRRMYSWWWDSHISPKNSKWLQENLTDIDSKVKAMVKIIEEDADSFARRAEMYYKKRPELMKLVEEFYRAYRALAERYDHATGALRQAHRTMAEAFPNQIPFGPADESPGNSASEADPRTPEMSTHVRAMFDPEDLQKDALGLSSPHFNKKNGAFTQESDSVTSRKGLKQLNDLFGSGGHAKLTEGKVRKVLNFQEAGENETGAEINENLENEILNLKEALAKLEAEKDSALIQHRQSLERFSNLEAEFSRAQEDSKDLSKQASEAEVEVQNLKEALSRLEAEKEASLMQYQECLEKVSNLEITLSDAQKDIVELNERASKSETEAQSLKQDLAKLEAEKDAALDQYKQSLDMISDLQNKLLHAEEGARKLRERAEKVESEVETLKQAINKLTEEKEAAALQYQQCLETISSLERDISFAQDEAQRLNGEIDNGVAKLKGAEEKCLLLERSNQSLHSELESLSLKMGAQSRELTEKQKELGRVWTCLQEERLRYIDAETAFQTLQRLHSQAQEELRSMASELENKAQVLADMETRNQSLQCEILKLMEKNKSLNEINLTSAMSMKGMQNEIFSLRETKGKLEEEVELRVDQRNALQQEIYCLKEELNDLNKKYLAISEQVDALGLNPESFKSSVNELRNENKDLKETCEIERSEKLALLEKLEIMEQLLEKNALLENSLSDLGAELEGVRGKIKTLGESCASLLEEKSMLVDENAALLTQIQVTTENLGEKNTVLENSLSDAHDELEVLKEKSKSLEDSCLLLINEKSGLISEKNTLISQMEITKQILKDLEEKFVELEEKHLALEKQKKSTLCKVEELKICLDVQKQEHVGFVQMSETRLAGMEMQIHLLQEESQHINKELGEELDKALDSQIETFVLQGCVQDLKEKNFSLSIECQKLLEASELSAQLISEFERENLKQQLEVKLLFDQNNTWRIGMHQLSKALGVVLDDGHGNKNGLDQACLYNMLSKVQDIDYSLCEAQDENQQRAIELSILVTLLGHLKSEMSKLEIEKDTIDQNLTIRTEQFLAEESRAHKLLEVTEDLRSEVKEGDHREEVLTTQIKDLHSKVLDVQGAYEILQKEKAQVLEEKLSLTKEFVLMEDRKRIVEEENCAIFGEMLSMSNLSLIFKNYGNEKSMELKELGEDLDELQGVNVILQEKLSIMERKLAEVQMENLNLKETLQKSEHELIAVTFVSDQLNYEIANGKNLLQQKEKELLETEQKLSGTENEKLKLRKIVEDLKRKCDEVEITREDQEKQIIDLKVELLQLHEEHEKSRYREENLSSQLQKGNNEIEMWETQAAAFYGELQTSTLVQALFEEKVHELTEACENLQDEHSFRVADIELLKERVKIVEGENEGLKAQLAPYAPAIISLRDSISSLENHICLHTNLQNSNSKEEKVTDLANGVHVESDLNEEKKATVSDACSDLQDLQTRVKAIERSVIEIKTLVMQGNVKPTSEISEVEIGLLTKDIVLDQISECSSHGISSREHAESDNQMLELWETAHQDGNIDLTVTKGKKVEYTSPTEKDIKYHRVEAVKQKNKYPISDFAVEKDLSVDKLEILSKRFTEPRQEGNKRKILERLNSDVQKLTNLQITVQDLKKKVEIIENNRKGKPVVECDTLKSQLEEAEDAILKLFDLNGKLMKNFEDDNSFSSDKKSAMESEEIGSVSRRRTSEQARRASEKIGRLQLEVQKIQFVLLKIDVEKDGNARGRILDSKRSVLLRDYLYGGGVRKINHKKKKAPFCACIQPPTKGD